MRFRLHLRDINSVHFVVQSETVFIIIATYDKKGYFFYCLVKVLHLQDRLSINKTNRPIQKYQNTSCSIMLLAGTKIPSVALVETPQPMLLVPTVTF